jgi:ribosomal-protein-alanine N-acetyltransferase
MLERKRREGIRTIWLEVRASNQAARALYASLGFVEAGVRPNYYTPVSEGAPREAAIVMRLNLADDENG